MTDNEIVELFFARSENAIKLISEKYHAYCYSISFQILSNKEDCEECVNDTWMKAWNAMPDARPSILSAFLGSITRNICLDRYRKIHTAKRGSGQVDFIFDELLDLTDGKEPLHYIEEKELADSINRFLKNLPKEHRIIFVRRYWYMDPIAEIARRCMCTESKIKTVLFRIRGKLMEHLKMEGFVQ